MKSHAAPKRPKAPRAVSEADLTHPPKPPEKGQPPPNLCGMAMFRTMNGVMTMEVKGVTLEQYAQRLSGQTDRPVIDKTGIAGLYNFHLEFTPDESTPWLIPPGGAAPSDPAGGPSIFTAIQEQLGLKLESAKGPGETLVIDSVERPSEN